MLGPEREYYFEWNHFLITSSTPNILFSFVSGSYYYMHNSKWEMNIFFKKIKAAIIY